MFLDREAFQRYGNCEIKGTSSLPFRELPSLVQRYVRGSVAIDFGCGAGRSSRFLKSLGLDVVGVDESPEIFEEAKIKEPAGEYVLIERNQTGFEDGRFDFLFSSFVLYMLPSKGAVLDLLCECHRVLRFGGVAIFVTGSEALHSPEYQWVSYNNDFPENRDLRSGGPVRLELKEAGAVFQDYQWTDHDNREMFSESGFEILETVAPLGRDDEGGEWLSEMRTAPFLMYVLRK